MKKNINLNFKLTGDQRNRISKKILASRRLFFITLVGALAIYSFNIAFRKVYVELNFVQYDPTTGFINTYHEGKNLDAIIQNIDKRKDNLKGGEDKKYKDPFNFSNTAEQDSGATENDNTQQVQTGRPDTYPASQAKY